MSVFDVLNLEQGSEEWKQERLKYLTASQVPTLLGLSPYQKIPALLEEKISGKEAEVGSYKEYLFQKGHDAEAAGRAWIESDMGIKFPPAVVLSKACPGLLASLDGFNQDNPENRLTFEAKFMGAKALEEVKQGKIKPHHECQVQAQLLATGAKMCVYFATTTDGDSAIVNIKPDPAYAAKITEAVAEFMRDLNELRRLLNSYERFKVQLIDKHKNKGLAPLKILASGAVDPFRLKAR
jgi:putative phage-type endonuclease